MLHKGMWFEEMINNRNKSTVSQPPACRPSVARRGADRGYPAARRHRCGA